MKQVVWTHDISWEDTVRQAEHEDVVIMRDGHAVALMVPFDDEELDWYLREHDPQFISSIARARQQVVAGQTVAHDELKRHLGID